MNDTFATIQAFKKPRSWSGIAKDDHTYRLFHVCARQRRMAAATDAFWERRNQEAMLARLSRGRIIHPTRSGYTLMAEDAAEIGGSESARHYFVDLRFTAGDGGPNAKLPVHRWRPGELIR